MGKCPVSLPLIVNGFEKAGEYDYPVGRTLDREFILRRIRA